MGKRPDKAKEKARKYSQSDLEKAIADFRKGKSLRQAAKEYNVPKTTIFNKLTGRYPVVSKVGQPPTLSSETEKELVTWILECGDRWHPVTKSQILDSVEVLCQHYQIPNKFTNGRPGNVWYRSFLKRHPDLSKRTPETYSLKRAGVREEDITESEWFTSVGEYLKQKNLVNLPPNRVFNTDESGFFLSPKGDKVIVRLGERVVAQVATGGEKTSVTVLFTISAAGDLVPPMVVHKIENFTEILAASNVKGWNMGKSDTGWMTGPLFYEYIANKFYPWLVKQGVQFPVILYLDGHASHITLELTKFCRSKQIELILLYPNATHILQPLDTAFFKPLKQAYKHSVTIWRSKHGYKQLQPRLLPGVLQDALNVVPLKEVGRNGFRSCGLLPFDQSAVRKDKYLGATRKEKSADIQQKELSNEESGATVSISECKNTLKLIQSFVPPCIFEKFILCKDKDYFDGPITYDELFNFWRDVNLKYDVLILSTADEDSNTSASMDLMNINDIPIIFENEASSIIENYELEDAMRNDEVEMEDLKDTMDVDVDEKHIIMTILSPPSSPPTPPIQNSSSSLKSPPVALVDNFIEFGNDLDDSNNNDFKSPHDIVEGVDPLLSPLTPTLESPQIQDDSQLSPLEVLKKYVYYPEDFPGKKKKKKSPTVLTSEEAIAIAQEKADQKKKKRDDIDERKVQRAAKRKLKEEEDVKKKKMRLKKLQEDLEKLQK
ncbi:uncharacterized protein DMENIID0001_065250 [Sergentomyia squamirostris]